MPRIRTIKPDFFLDSELAELGIMARLFFIGLWTQADKMGRFEEDLPRLKVQILPYDNVKIEPILAQLCPKYLIRYEFEGKKYCQIRNFSKHQRPHHTEPESKLPSPSIKPNKDGYYPFKHGENPSVHGEYLEGREGKGRERILDTGEGKGKDIHGYELLNQWNNLAIRSQGVFPAVKAFSHARAEKCKLRLKEISPGDWDIIFAKLEASKFLRGEIGTWRATFDWLIDNDKNALKVLEGNYDNRTEAGANEGIRAKPGKYAKYSTAAGRAAHNLARESREIESGDSGQEITEIREAEVA